MNNKFYSEQNGAPTWYPPFNPLQELQKEGERRKEFDEFQRITGLAHTTENVLAWGEVMKEKEKEKEDREWEVQLEGDQHGGDNVLEEEWDDPAVQINPRWEKCGAHGGPYFY